MSVGKKKFKPFVVFLYVQEVDTWRSSRKIKWRCYTPSSEFEAVESSNLVIILPCLGFLHEVSRCEGLDCWCAGVRLPRPWCHGDTMASRASLGLSSKPKLQLFADCITSPRGAGAEVARGARQGQHHRAGDRIPSCMRLTYQIKLQRRDQGSQRSTW